MAKAKILKFLKVCFRSIFGAFQKCISKLHSWKSAFQKCIPGAFLQKKCFPGAFLEAKPAKNAKKLGKVHFWSIPKVHSKSAFLEKCIPKVHSWSIPGSKASQKCKKPRKSAFLEHSTSAFQTCIPGKVHSKSAFLEHSSKKSAFLEHSWKQSQPKMQKN